MENVKIEQYLPSLVARSVEIFVDDTIIPGVARTRERRLENATERAIYPRMAPMSVAMRTVCLFADISGFTKMTKALSLKGPKGAEQIVQNLNTYLEQVVKEIICAGGDIIKFAGDAMIAIWPPKRRSTLAEQEKLLEKNVWSACRCALGIQQNWGTFHIGHLTLRIKLG